MTEIRNVLVNKSSNQKFIIIPKRSDIKPGDRVIIQKLPDISLKVEDS